MTHSEAPSNLFISYSWKNKDIVDEIEASLQYANISIRRDVRDINYRESIKSFMKSIRKSDFVLIVLSDSYLKSNNCMYEILELFKDETYRERILPVVIDNSVYNAYHEYIDYWERKTLELRNQAKSLDPKNIGPITKDLVIYENVCSTIGEFLELINDMNCLSFEELKEQRYRPILKVLNFDNIKNLTELLGVFSSIDRNEAVKKLTDKLESTPYKKEALFMLSLIYCEQDKFDLAIESLTKLLAIDNTMVAAYNNRGRAYYFLKDFDRAVSDFNKAISIDKNFAAPYQNLGNIYYYTNEINKSIEFYDKAIELESDNSNFYYSRANAQRDNNDIELAIKDYNKAIELNKKSTPAYNNRGDLFRRMGDYTKAEQDFLIAIGFDSNDSKPIYNLAIVCYDKKEYLKAAALYSKYIEMQPDDSSGYLGRAYSYIFAVVQNKNSDIGNDANSTEWVLGAFKDLEKASEMGNSIAKKMLEECKNLFPFTYISGG